MSHNRTWCPPLPTIGRHGTRVKLPEEVTFTDKLKVYLEDRKSCPSMFISRMNKRWLRQHHPEYLYEDAPYLHQVTGAVAYKYILYSIGQTMSLHFQRKLGFLCNKKNGISTIERWFHTADGMVLPLLLTVDDSDTMYPEINKLTKSCLENCANNYAHFISRLKTVKRLIRKDMALDTQSAKKITDLSYYRNLYLRFLPVGLHDSAQYMMCWTQTRATGLANGDMMLHSLDKAEALLSQKPPLVSGSLEFALSGRQPQGCPIVDREILRSLYENSYRRVRGNLAHVSAGPKACLEFTQPMGGQTGMISRLCKTKSLHRVYNFVDLTYVEIPPRPCRSATDLLSWAIQNVHEHPTASRVVRQHVVAEPSKARLITVASMSFQIILGVVARILTPMVTNEVTNSGFKASRNLWSFLYDDLDHTDSLWGELRDEARGGKIYALSSDLETATDSGDPRVSRQILSYLLSRVAIIPGSPLGLLALGKTLFQSKRFVLKNFSTNRFSFFTKTWGWFMGDRLTKVVLTASHNIAVVKSGLFCARLVGDDVSALSKKPELLEAYEKSVSETGMILSVDDHFVSSKLMFYCEELALVPQGIRDLPAFNVRRGRQSCYIDYPRIRLMIPTRSETDRYSYTDVGRFALLGKEARWVAQNGSPRSRALFERASLLQHVMVPQPGGTLCPFIPLEIGGDGAFTADATLLGSMIRKSRNPDEVNYRLSNLMKGTWGFRFVRNEYLDNVIHKHHILAPKIAAMRNLLPEGSIIEGNQLLLRSIKTSLIEDPEHTMFRLWRAWYYHELLAGNDLPQIDLSIDRSHLGPVTKIEVDYEEFIHIWRDIGFTFENQSDYLVLKDMVMSLDHMNLNMAFRGSDEHSGTNVDIGRAALRANPTLRSDATMEEFLTAIRNDMDPPQKVLDRLHLYVESDSYIKNNMAKLEKPPEFLILISRDQRLALDVARILRSKLTGDDWRVKRGPLTKVVLVDPIVYLYGMLDCVTSSLSSDNHLVVTDPGSIAFASLDENPTEVFFDETICTLSASRRGPEVQIATLHGRGDSYTLSLTRPENLDANLNLR